MFKSVTSFIALMRMKQWAKNAFIFFPILFSGKASNMDLLWRVCLTFVSFCLAASSVYILNDYLDRHKDKLHPKKSHRPIASGKITEKVAIFFIFTVMALGIWISLEVDPIILYAVVIYIYLHLIYNYFTKTIVIIDVIFVAIGFQIRIWAGSYACDVLPSVWLQLCVFLLALFLGFTKRRHEISILKDQATEHRSVLSHYTTYLLDQIIIICSSLTIVFYGLYSISSDIVARVGSDKMVYSIPFVIYGIFRYLYLVHVKKLGEDPGETMFADAPLMINILLWITYLYFVIYY